MAIEIIYWDSDCFLGYFNREADKINKCTGTVDKAKSGDLKIAVSTITLTEVIKLKGKPKLKQEQEELIRKFFENDFIVMFNLNRWTAELARHLIWEYSNLDPKDSIHVATALFNNIPILNTFDEELKKLNEKFKLSDKSKNLIICEPILPSQSELFNTD